MHNIENLTFEFWFPCLLSALPILYAIIRWGYKIVKKERKKALIFENIESKQYIHKEHDKVELRVLYNKKINYDAIVILKARIKNIGKEDISKTTLVDPLKISCTDDYTIINATIINPSERIRPNITFSQQSIELSWDLLKHGKEIELEIIACINNPSEKTELAIDFYNSLLVDVNAEGIDSVDKNIELSRKEQGMQIRKKFLWVYFVMMLILSGYLIFIQPRNIVQYNVEYLISTDSTQFVSTIGFSSHKEMLCVNDEREQKAYSSIADFNSSNRIIKIESIKEAANSAKKNSEVSLWMCVVMTAMILIIGILTYVEGYMLKKRRGQFNK